MFYLAALTVPGNGDVAWTKQGPQLLEVDMLVREMDKQLAEGGMLEVGVAGYHVQACQEGSTCHLAIGSCQVWKGC